MADIGVWEGEDEFDNEDLCCEECGGEYGNCECSVEKDDYEKCNDHFCDRYKDRMREDS